MLSRVLCSRSLPACSFLIRTMATDAQGVTAVAGVVQRTIQEKLETQLKPVHLEVINESFMHNVPKGSESHFKVIVVSSTFDGVALIKRHRMVMDILGEQLQEGVHALSIQADTPAHWESRGVKVTQSPPCLGGSKR